ncbi:MAG: hypothetical protein IPG88_25605 [Gemmatimonadetes bacterium]|nr:hypothetical protein [Gemmatimonadota bacterium]
MAVGAIALLAAVAPVARAQGRVVVDTVRARTLVGNRVGDPAKREVYTYLPPSYDRDRTRHFPVLYLLHGMTSHPREWLDGSYQGFDLRRTMDSLARTGSEFLVVMPHADNSYGGTFYVNSVAFGRWDDFIGRELVGYIDGRYRTMRDRRHRGIAGQSMGGFGALSIVQSHSATFANVYAMSPCCLTLAADLAPASPLWLAASRLAPATPPRTTGERIVRAMAIAFAPSFRRGAPLVLPHATCWHHSRGARGAAHVGALSPGRSPGARPRPRAGALRDRHRLRHVRPGGERSGRGPRLFGGAAARRHRAYRRGLRRRARRQGARPVRAAPAPVLRPRLRQ